MGAEGNSLHKKPNVKELGMEMGAWDHLKCGNDALKLTLKKTVVLVANDICLPIST